MGYRLHHIKKRETVYGAECFNWRTAEVHKLLIDIFEDVYINDSEDYVEIPKEIYKENLEKIKELKESPIEGYTVQEIYDYFKQALEDAETYVDFIMFEWF